MQDAVRRTTTTGKYREYWERSGDGMEHISVKKKIDRLIVTHKIEKTEQISTMELDIINKAEIPALLPVHIGRTMTGKEIRFVVQNFMDLRSFLKSDIRFDLFIQIVLQIVDTLLACESHGIRCGNLELSSDLSFYDYGNRQVRLICWPLISLSANSNASSFFMELGSIYTSKGHDSDFRLRYLQFFDSRAKFELDDFKQRLETLLQQWQEENAEGAEQGGKSKPRKPRDIPPTVGLRMASIQRISTQTTIQVSRYPFSIGRKAEFCDYAIEDNPYVSKRHATILLRDGQAYIRDNGSSNGTFLNGKRLQPNTEVELPSGACFRIGNESFVFRAAGG